MWKPVFSNITIAVGIIGAMSLLSGEKQSPEAFPDSVHASYRCTDRYLEGRYAISGDGAVVQPPAGFSAGPIAEVGLWEFHGNGLFDGKATASLNGTIFDLLIDGTYQVQSDCTVALTINTTVSGHAGPILHAKGVIASEGRDIEMITTDAGTTQYRTLKKQFSRR